MSRRRKLALAGTALLLAHAAAVLAGFLAPYDFALQHRDYAYARPARLHFSGFRAYVCAPVVDVSQAAREDCGRRFPLRFFVDSGAGTRLFGVDPPGVIFLLGADGSGRDVFSRVLYGARISLFTGVAAAGISLALALALGGIAGFRGGWPDRLLMRGGELMMALPWLYLLLAARAMLPLNITPAESFLLVTAIIGGVGWVRPARLIRAVALSARERGFVQAARGFGASGPYLMRRHVLPLAWGVAVTQGSLLVPHFILAEVTLSFLGLGVGEPVPSWGSMLADARQVHSLVSHEWLLAPGAALVAVLLLYMVVADALLDR